MFFRKKKEEKAERRLTPEQAKTKKEAEKWIQILRNVTVYDGTGKGQIHIER